MSSAPLQATVLRRNLYMVVRHKDGKPEALVTDKDPVKHGFMPAGSTTAFISPQGRNSYSVNVLFHGKTAAEQQHRWLLTRAGLMYDGWTPSIARMAKAVLDEPKIRAALPGFDAFCAGANQALQKTAATYKWTA